MINKIQLENIKSKIQRGEETNQDCLDLVEYIEHWTTEECEHCELRQ